jgi:hypothetical protein
MPHGTEAVKVIDGALALGFSLSEAVQRALGRTLTAFAADKPYSVQSVSMCLAAYEGRVYPEIRDDLCAELEIPREYIDGRIADVSARRSAQQQDVA